MSRVHPLATALAPFVAVHDSFTCRQLVILAALQGSPPEDRTVRGLAAQFNIPKPCVTRAVDVLEAQGLVTRKQELHDRRSVIMALTKSGEKLLAIAV